MLRLQGARDCVATAEWARFRGDPAEARFRPERLYKLARSKAYLFRGVEIRWKCDPKLLAEGGDIPAEDTIPFRRGSTS